MIFHVLNGDELAGKFPKEIEGQKIVISEAFMEGPVSILYDDPYWSERAGYIAETYQGTQDVYAENFLKQLNLLKEVNSGSTIYLWFEDDLFCQANMWFVVHYITRYSQPKFFRVFPQEDSKKWTGFGNAGSAELPELYRQSKTFDSDEVELTCSLWEAFVKEDHPGLKRLAASHSNGIRFLSEVVRAHLDRKSKNGKPGRPQAILQEIMDEGKRTFPEIFEAFSLRAGIYGFGDVQVKNMLKHMY